MHESEAPAPRVRSSGTLSPQCGSGADLEPATQRRPCLLRRLRTFQVIMIRDVAARRASSAPGTIYGYRSCTIGQSYDLSSSLVLGFSLRHHSLFRLLMKK